MSYCDLGQLNKYVGNAPWCYSVEKAMMGSPNHFSKPVKETFKTEQATVRSRQNTCGNCGRSLTNPVKIYHR